MISIIVPNYNHAAFLNERLNSILNQSYSNFEIIILDDCSTDNSRDIIKTYQSHPKVSHIVFNEINSGSPFLQWKKGIALAKGKLIWIAESDDFADSLLLETLVEAFSKDENLGLSYCSSFKINEKGEFDKTITLPKGSDFTSDYSNIGPNEIKTKLFKGNSIPNASAVLFKKSLFPIENEWIENYKLCGDWYCWINLLNKSKVHFTAKPLNYFRFTENSVRSKTKHSDSLSEELEIIKYILSLFPNDFQFKSTVLDRLIFLYNIQLLRKDQKIIKCTLSQLNRWWYLYQLKFKLSTLIKSIKLNKKD